VPKRGVRLCQETSPGSCQEPCAPRPWRPVWETVGRHRGIKGVTTVQFHLDRLGHCLPSHFWVQGSAPPSSDGEDPGGVKTGGRLETMWLVSHQRARREMTAPFLAGDTPKAGGWAPDTSNSWYRHIPPHNAEGASCRQLRPVFP